MAVFCQRGIVLSDGMNQKRRKMNTKTLFPKTLLVAAILFAHGCAVPVGSHSEESETKVAVGENPSAQTLSEPSALPVNAPEALPPVEKVKHNAISEKQLNAQQMSQILEAELLARRGGMEQAFALYYQIAQQTSDPKVLKRTFELSMGTYNVEHIRQATNLWKTQDPTADLAWRAAFLLSLQEGEVEQAFSEWQTYQSLSELSLEQDLMVAARRIAASVRAETGMVFFEKVTTEYPDNWASHYGMAVVAASQNMPQLAIEALKQSVKVASSEQKPQIYQTLANLYVEVSAVTEGIEDLGIYLQEYPDDLVVQERLARLQVLAEDFSGAKQRYELILEKDEEADKSRLSLALLQMELEEYDAAMANFERLKVKKPYEAVSNYYLGITLQELKRYDEALESFAKTLNSNYAVDAYLHSAEIYFALGQKAKAFEQLDQIPTQQPENLIKQLRAKAIFQTYDENYAEALELYQQVLAVQPNVSVMLAMSYIHYNQGQFDAYENLLLKALQLDENNVEALNGLGYFYVERNEKLDAAKGLLARALAIEPQNYYILDSMGWLYYQLGEITKSIEYLEKAFSIQTDDEVFVHLVQAYLKNQQTAQAKALWDEFYPQLQSKDSVQTLQKQLEKTDFFD